MERHVDVAVIGSGTAGLNAFGTVRRAGKNAVLINGGELGTTCARVGCMPSKVMIQIAEDFHRRHIFNRSGIEGSDNLTIDVNESIEQVRDIRDIFVDRVLGSSTDNMPPEILIEGYAQLLAPDLLEVNGEKIRADKIILCTGSRPVLPVAWEAFGDKILTTDDLFEQEQLPEKMAVIGLGVIGLELGQSLHRLGIEITGFDLDNKISGITDPKVNQMAIDTIGKEFPIHLGEAASIERLDNGQLKVSAGEHSVIVDKVLASLGRKPNLDKIGLDKIGVKLNENGLPNVNVNTMQIENTTLYMAGDMTGDKAILHEAGHEGKIAGYNASQTNITAFKRKTPLAITFCDPNIASVGQSLSELNPDNIVIGEIPFAPVGRALIMGKNRGLLRVYADKKDGRLLGASMVCAHGEHLSHLIAWSIEQKLTVVDMLRMPFYHPVLEEALQAALNNTLDKLDLKFEQPVDLQVL